MFTGQLIGYVGADARSNKSGKGFYFPVSSKFKGVGDTTALSMLNGHELVKEDFYTGIDQPGVFLEKDGFRKYIQKLEGKFRTENKYLSYIDYSVSFRRAMDLQVNQFVKAIETENVEEYMPVIIR